jgi:hypothetical protein
MENKNEENRADKIKEILSDEQQITEPCSDQSKKPSKCTGAPEIR